MFAWGCLFFVGLAVACGACLLCVYVCPISFLSFLVMYIRRPPYMCMYMYSAPRFFLGFVWLQLRMQSSYDVATTHPLSSSASNLPVRAVLDAGRMR